MANIPDEVAVVLPVRFPKGETAGVDWKLENDFSVTIMDLPTDGGDNYDEIKRRSDRLRNGADALVCNSIEVDTPANFHLAIKVQKF